MPQGGTRETTVQEHWLTEAQILKLCGRSTTPIAEAILDEMIAVYMAVRRGQTVAAQAPAPPFVDGGRQFCELVARARAQGRCHLAPAEGPTPKDAPGLCIGQLGAEPGEVFLRLASAYEVARVTARASGVALALSAEDVGRHLYDAGELLATELETRRTYTIRRRVGGRTSGGWLRMKTSALAPRAFTPAPQAVREVPARTRREELLREMRSLAVETGDASLALAVLQLEASR